VSAATKSELRFEDAVGLLPAALYTTDSEGRITYFNAAAADFWGRRPVLGEEMWCGSWRLYWPDGTPMPHEDCPMAVTVKTGKPVRGAKAIAERPDGVRFDFTPSPTPIFDADGRLTAAVNMLVKIPGAKQVEEIAGQLTWLDAAATLIPRELAIAWLFDHTTRLLHRDDPDARALQSAIVSFLSHSKSARSAADIADYLGVSTSIVAQDVSLLVRQGFIERASDPSGVEKLILTDRGRALTQFDPLQRLAGAIRGLSEARQAEFAKDLEYLADHLKQDEDRAE
jgi:PAS domain S-box-containing protein